jgi:hypothetical protein
MGFSCFEKDDLNQRFHYVEETRKRVADDAAGVRLAVSDTKYVAALILPVFFFFSFLKSLVHGAERLDQLSRTTHDKVFEATSVISGKFSIL